MVPKTKCVTSCLVPAETPLQYVGRAYLSWDREVQDHVKVVAWALSHLLLTAHSSGPRNIQRLPENLTLVQQSELNCTSSSHEKQRNLNRLALGWLYSFLNCCSLVFSSGFLLLTHLNTAGQQNFSIASLSSLCQIITHVAKAPTKCQLIFKSFIVKKKK